MDANSVEVSTELKNIWTGKMKLPGWKWYWKNKLEKIKGYEA